MSTDPGLPMKKGRAGTMTHDDQRHGTTTLFAALARNPRVHFHCTPTSASWLHLVERCFGELTQRQIRRLAVTRVDHLIATITAYI